MSLRQFFFFVAVGVISSLATDYIRGKLGRKL